jgi:CRP-like cAMP-binding protein
MANRKYSVNHRGSRQNNKSGNRLIDALPSKDRERLLAKTEEVQLELRESLYTPDEPIRYVYFPLTFVASMVSDLGNGGSLEVGTVGNEGMVGIPVFLGTTRVPFRMFAQVAGEALQMEAAALHEEVEQSERLRELLNAYVQAFFTQLSQSVVCNRFHTIEQRFCRWVLMTRDRVGSDTFPLTQDFIGQMLGVRRASVHEVAAKAREEGLLDYNRGVIHILDSRKLKARACECYQIVKDEYDRLLDYPHAIQRR